MGRHPRIHFPGAFFHITVRGNNRQSIFTRKDDFEYFLKLLADGTERFGHRIHAFCLMPNHVHLAVEVADISLSRIVHNFAFRYAKLFNQKYQRTGHLFERRYWAGLIETDGNLQLLARYIHLNPVRAKLVTRAVDYPWSSHAEFLGRRTTSFLTTGTVLGLFSKSSEKARAHFTSFVDQGPENTTVHGKEEDAGKGFSRSGIQRLTEPPHKTIKVRRAAVPKILSGARSISIRTILEVVAHVTATSVQALSHPGQNHARSSARAIAAFFVHQLPGLTLRQLGHVLQRDASTLSRAAASVASRIEHDATLERQVSRAQKLLEQLAVS